jgi:hypothetical protein
VSYPGTLGDGAGSTASITARTGGTVTLSGPIADGVDSGGGITVSGNSGGSTVFSNASKVLHTGTGDGVLMDSNTGHSVTFSGGGLAIDTTTGKGFEATGGGTVAVSFDGGNTIDTTTGRALNVDSTDISLSGLTFEHISAGTAVAGPVNGIRLNGTGTAGGLYVTGGFVGTDSGGTIQHTTGDGVLLKDTSDPTLASMGIRDSGDSGIAADGVARLRLAADNLSGNGAQAEGGAVQDAGIHLEDMQGTSNFDGIQVTDSHNSNIDWDPNTSSALSTVRVGTSSIASAGENPGEGGAGISLLASGSANVKLAVDQLTQVGSNHEQGIRATSAGGTTTRVDVSGAQLTNNGQAGVRLAAVGTADARYRVTGSGFQGNGSSAVDLQGSDSAKVDGTVTSNTIGDPDTAASGSATQPGVELLGSGDADVAAEIASNTIFHTAAHGIEVQTFGDNAGDPGHMDATVRDNTVGTPDQVSFNGISLLGAFDVVNCFDLAGNDADGSGTGSDLSLTQGGDAVVNLERFTGDGTDDAAVESYMLAENPLSDSAFAQHTTGFTGVDDETCQSPALP